ncbi:chlorite dismutase family protein [Salsipaludibacter albus]|uniref:chlorite dismutase family protein n=1 Tax=Salsipaludibacter albus TaxID=2849650 RepID=UPI001EE40AE9|nr:chlorite dismutase family protein [Salsipaludibacter albus]
MIEPVTPGEGWGVLHLFLRRAPDAPTTHPEVGTDLATALDKVAAEVQTHVFTGLGHKADLVVMLLDADLVRLRAAQTSIELAAGTAFTLDWSYLSLTEGSEYTTTPEQYREQMADKGVAGEDLERRVEEFSERMATYADNKLHPDLPRWETMCFYPMSHRREGDDNWYALDFEERKRLMHDHGRSGRAYTGRVLQLVSGSTGLDDWEWGVTLLAHDVADLKDIVYTMRYDEASVRYAEFGPFVVGLRATARDAMTALGWDR